MKKTKKIIVIFLITLFLINFNPILSAESSINKTTNMKKDELNHPVDITGSYSFAGRWDGKLIDDTEVAGGLTGSVSHFGGIIGITNLNIQLKIGDEFYREIDCNMFYRFHLSYPFKILESTWFFYWGIYWGEMSDPDTFEDEFIVGRIYGLPVDDWYDYGSFVKADSFKNLHLKFNFDE